MKQSTFFLFASLCTAAASAAPITALPFKAAAKIPDQAEALSPSAIHIEGWLGARIEANATNRLLHVDTEPLLAGFRKKPGSHPWIGEHVGKWLHAATLAWAYTGDPALRQKLDAVAADLVKAQEPDGYLGTYVPDKRFGLYREADWDVWSHKYNLMGLLTYYQYTGNEPALEACRKMGDLLIATFPAKRSIIAAGTHVGMAATSVLEPVVLLYRVTGEERYLDFARYIVKAWDEPNGPKIIQALLNAKQVNKTANGKAYEMLSNLVGLCELARATGDASLLTAVLNAWQDIVDSRLYVTGSASAGEHFQGDHVLPNQPGAHICETCVTTTWIQLNLQLLRLTGEARFGNELERTFYNHLAAAQHPAGADWCYYTALEGKKPYDPGINCCHSSGPRGMALAPQAAFLKIRQDGDDGLAVSTFETSRAVLEIGGQTVRAEQRSEFPRRAGSALTFRMDRPSKFAVWVREPAWAAPLTLQVGGQAVATVAANGWLKIPARPWRDGDSIKASFSLGGSVLSGQHGNAGRVALRWGPFVLAYDEKKNPGLPAATAVGLAEVAKPPFVLQPGEPLTFQAEVRTRRLTEPRPALFVAFADAGADGGAYRVWVRAPGADGGGNESLLADGQETRSRQGNQNGSINDGDPDSIAVTFDGQAASEDWYAVTLRQPVKVGRVVFSHGKSFHDGGWFDAGAGKPRVQVQREPNGAWETVGELTGYPATTASRNARLADGQKFTLKLPEAMTVVAVRVLGKPAQGDNSRQSFSSCGELEAFAE
jgi:uncharacterized protein